MPSHQQNSDYFNQQMIKAKEDSTPLDFTKKERGSEKGKKKSKNDLMKKDKKI